MDEQLWQRSRIGRVITGDGPAMRRWRRATRLALGAVATRWQDDTDLDEKAAAEELGITVARYHALRFAEAAWTPDELHQFADATGHDPDELLAEIIDVAATQAGGPPAELQGSIGARSWLVKQLVALSTDERTQVLRTVMARHPRAAEDLRRALDNVEDW